MKIIRSSKCSMRFTTAKKRQLVDRILPEYGRVVNLFIDMFWFNPLKNAKDLRKTDLHKVKSWCSENIKKYAAREALSMIWAVKNRKRKKGDKTTPKKPRHRGKSMRLSSPVVKFQLPKKTKEYNAWLHLTSVGNKIKFNVPVKFHSHYNELAQQGRRMNSYIITRNYIQFCFKINVEPKLQRTGCVGLDTGMNSLAATSTGEEFGTEINQYIERVKRCKYGSNGQKRARRCLRHYIDTLAKGIVNMDGLTLLVIEELKNITKNTKNPSRRLGKEMRRNIGAWNVRYFHMRLKLACERNRVSLNRVSAYYTSRTCSVCNRQHKDNRNGKVFCCIFCGHADDADINAGKVILQRFLKYLEKYHKKKYAECICLPDRRKRQLLTPLQIKVPVMSNMSILVRRPDNATGQLIPVKWS